jgi:hypothetical protein
MQTHLLETMVQMQHAKHGSKTPVNRKMKNDAIKTLGERTKKQHDTPRALQVGYKEEHVTTFE